MRFPALDCAERGLSLPARGAWIEMLTKNASAADVRRRSPQGERGLKFGSPGNQMCSGIVAPRKGSVD